MDALQPIGVAEIALQGMAVRAVYITAAVLLLLALARLFNKLTGDRFDAWLDKATAHGTLGAGIYFSARFLGIALIVAKFLP